MDAVDKCSGIWQFFRLYALIWGKLHLKNNVRNGRWRRNRRVPTRWNLAGHVEVSSLWRAEVVSPHGGNHRVGVEPEMNFPSYVGDHTDRSTAACEDTRTAVSWKEQNSAWNCARQGCTSLAARGPLSEPGYSACRQQAWKTGLQGDDWHTKEIGGRLRLAFAACLGSAQPVRRHCGDRSR